MKLILTDYIASLKEEKELDALLQDLLREYDCEIYFGPQKGERQHGVDIYAVGEDWKDGRIKVFLVTVKQGNLDRNNWHGSAQGLEPSLHEIISVFIRNKIAPEHLGLPIKIIVAHNGVNISAIQENWRGLADRYPAFEFEIWQLETIVNMVTDRMMNENVLSLDARPLLRRVVIYLERPDYDFKEYKVLLEELFRHVTMATGSKKQDIRQLRKINLLFSIVLFYCRKENDLRLALRLSEITILRVWKFISENEINIDGDHLLEFWRSLGLRTEVCQQYLNRIYPVCQIRDGFSKYCNDSVTYNQVVYEHLGFLAMAGLEFLQLKELFAKSHPETSEVQDENAVACASAIIQLFNNNSIAYIPRTDDQIIELTLVFMLLYKIGQTENINKLLLELNSKIEGAKLLSGIAPNFENNWETVFELQMNYEKRAVSTYPSSCLLPVLAEWCLITKSLTTYEAYVELKDKVFPDTDLIMWYPGNDTLDLLYSAKAYSKSGYTLSNIRLEHYDSFANITLTDFVHNSPESQFNFFEQGFWTIGLVASRHHRTLIFPYYWRQFLHTTCEITPK